MSDDNELFKIRLGEVIKHANEIGAQGIANTDGWEWSLLLRQISAVQEIIKQHVAARSAGESRG